MPDKIILPKRKKHGYKMKPYRKRFNILYYLIICLVLLGPSILAAQTRTSSGAMEGSHKRPPVSRTEKKPERFVTIDFNNVDISVFIKFVSDLTGKNFIIDRRVNTRFRKTSDYRHILEKAKAAGMVTTIH